VTIYNLLLTLHVTSKGDPASDGPLLEFISTCPDDPVTGRPYYDLDYALRLCKANGKTQACVLIYSKMGLYEDSVDLALDKGDLELAKTNADRPEDDDILRKKLWLKIAKYVVQEKHDIKSYVSTLVYELTYRAIRFLEATDLVKIEDILPFFPDFVVIDDFKIEICSALEDYATKIESLRSEMDNATQSAESIKKDIENLRSRFVTIDKEDKCWKCGLGLVSKGFYVFPCQHAFHTDCLISMVSFFLLDDAKLTSRQWSSYLPHHFGGYITYKKNSSRNPIQQVEHSCHLLSPLVLEVPLQLARARLKRLRVQQQQTSY